jgi:hypothetical protein
VTIIGDISGDGAVGMPDVSFLNMYWYDPPVIGGSGYNQKADFNQDGIIDIFDAAILNLNWGRNW